MTDGGQSAASPGAGRSGPAGSAPPSLGARLAEGAPWVACATLSGMMLFLASPPLGLWPLAYVALVPALLAAGRARSYGWAALCAVLSAAFAYVPGYAWVASVAVAGWLGLALYVGLYLLAFLLVVRMLRRAFPRAWPVLAAVWWVALELARAHLGPGFPWLFFGYTQYRFGALLQVASLGGVYLVSFLVVFANAALAALIDALLLPRRASRTVGRAALVCGASAALLVAGAVWGGRTARNLELREGPVVGVIQQNIPRLVSELYSPDKPIEDSYREREAEVQLCAQLSALLYDPDVRLIVWPETSVPVPLDMPASSFAIRRERAIQARALSYFSLLGRRMGCHFLVGAPSYVSPEAARGLFYGLSATAEFGNSVILLSPEAEFLARYDKIRLVPFGEYIPWREHLPFLQRLTPIPREISPGREEVVFALPSKGGQGVLRFAALVCYEDVFPDLCASFRRKGADVLVNVTDEGWYHVPGELRQHLAMAVFRAVETRTTVVRAANTGISCFISPRGEVYEALEPLTRGALSARVRLCSTLTPYVIYGDTFAVACLMLALLLPAVLVALRDTAAPGGS